MSFTPRPLHPRVKIVRHPSKRKPSESNRQSGQFIHKTETSYTSRISKHGCSNRSARILVTILTELPQVLSGQRGMFL